MSIIEIHKRIIELKEWQFEFHDKIRIDPFWEGYNAAVIREIRFLEEKLKE